MYGFSHLTFGQRKARKVAVQVIPVIRYAEIDQKAELIPVDSSVSADRLADYISTHFASDEARVRALYRWLGCHISYDVAEMYSFSTEDEVPKLVNDLFIRRKAICEGYAQAFTMVCQRMHIRSYVVSGLTKRGKTVAAVSHAWNAAWIDGQWFLFDPTWGAGYLDQQEFVADPNDTFFMVTAGEFIPTHAPFDPLWQFLERPDSHRDFMAGKTQTDLSTTFFNFTDSLKVYDRQSITEQKAAQIQRIERSGVYNDLTFSYLGMLKHNLLVAQSNALNNQYNSAVDVYNQTVVLVNQFVNYRNNQFRPQKPEQEVRAMLDSISSNLVRMRFLTGQLSLDKTQLKGNIQLLEGLLLEVDKFLHEQKLFLTRYYKSPKFLRGLMFAK